MILKTCYAYIKVSQELFLHSTLRDYVIISSTKQNTTKKVWITYTFTLDTKWRKRIYLHWQKHKICKHNMFLIQKLCGLHKWHREICCCLKLWCVSQMIDRTNVKDNLYENRESIKHIQVSHMLYENLNYIMHK